MRLDFRSGLTAAIAFTLTAALAFAADKKLNTPPPGYKALFNGKDLSGWKGLVANPEKRAKMTPEELATAQKKADAEMRKHWKAVDGVLVFDGKGKNLCTAKDYGNFDLYVDWKIKPKGDSGIYLRGSPQVQIWDPDDGPRNAVGSGGLFNNKKHASKPLLKADNPVGQWNTFRIRMVGEKVTVWLNGRKVVDNTVMENYWNRKKPIYKTGAIELQNHGNTLYFRNIYIKELPSSDDSAQAPPAKKSAKKAGRKAGKRRAVNRRVARRKSARRPNRRRARRAVQRAKRRIRKRIRRANG